MNQLGQPLPRHKVKWKRRAVELGLDEGCCDFLILQSDLRIKLYYAGFYHACVDATKGFESFMNEHLMGNLGVDLPPVSSWLSQTNVNRIDQAAVESPFAGTALIEAIVWKGCAGRNDVSPKP